MPIVQTPPLSPLGERVGRTGVFTSRGGAGEGVVMLPPTKVEPSPTAGPQPLEAKYLTQSAYAGIRN